VRRRALPPDFAATSATAAVFPCDSTQWVLPLHPQQIRNVAALRNAKIIRNAEAHDSYRKLRRGGIFGGAGLVAQVGAGQP